MAEFSNQHTYLRYECADSFGLVTSAGAASSTRAPPSDATLQLLGDTTLVTTAGSYCHGFSLATGLLSCKWGHADYTGVGTGRALNTNQVLCVDVLEPGTVATGWLDGSVRIFEVLVQDKGSGSRETAFSLLDTDDHDDHQTLQERQDPLTLNGHAPSPVSAIALEKHHPGASTDNSLSSSRLASGGSDGVVIVWDLVAESGLFRLLGHQGAITQLHFVSTMTLVTASLDGLLKVWDLQAQCSVQTIATLRGEIWASALLSLSPRTTQQQQRHRLFVGSMEGQVRVWNVEAPQRQPPAKDNTDHDHVVRMEDATTTTTAAATNNKDDWCHDMGFLEAPLVHLATSSSKMDTNALTSKEKVTSIRASPYSPHVAILQANAKVIHVYAVRSVLEAARKRQRRLKRRQEKMHKKDANTKNDIPATNEKKRGILDDDEQEQEQEQDKNSNKDTHAASTNDPEQLKASDEIEYLGAIKANHKIKSFVFVPVTKTKRSTKQQQPKAIVQVACALSTNTIEIYSLERQPQKKELPGQPLQSVKVSNLTPLLGHATGVRAIALSSNDDMAATISKGTCKIWNVAHRTCLQSATLEPMMDPRKPQQSSMASFQGLCAVFLPGNTHVLVGTKEGHLLILDTAAAEIVYWEKEAHDNAIWSIDICHSKVATDSDSGASTCIVTGSADKMVKFWTLERQGDDGESDDDDEDTVLYLGAPMVVQTRALEMTDEVVAVKYSHSNFQNEKRRMVFVSTLDCTIKIFFEDSLKLFLSLYGHKLPALAVDSSDDDVLLVSGSADKTIKLWGLDFGDTHKTLHGHGDSVTDVRFVRGTHNFFSASKDGTVRYWDGDRFAMILVLRGHSAEVNCLAVSARNNGAFCLSGSMDRTVRVWERTRDIVFLEEERERELEQMFDEPNRRDEGGTARILDRKGRGDDINDDDDEAKQNEPQSDAAVKQSLMSISAGDRLLEALELADQELQACRSKSKTSTTRAANPMLMGMEPPQYVLWVLKSIKSADLEQSLLVLPLGHAERLLYYLVLLLKSGHSSVELCCRAAIFTVKTFQKQLVLNPASNAPLLRELRRLVHLRLKDARDTVGYNLAACRMIGRIAKERRDNKMLSTTPSTDIWAGLGLGSDVASALEGKTKKPRQRR